jgi:16S rRNA (uracil1498-N3)-methyltransferase
MALPRFYCPDLPPSGSALELPREAAHHAQRVLRLRVNDPVQLFDGNGCALNGKIREIGPKRVLVHELQTCIADAEPSLRIVLAQAMSSAEKMDWVVQKATELGAAEIQPVQTQRSVARLSGERAEKRTAHWRSVATAACEQCGRNTLPQIGAPLELGAWLSLLRGRDAAKFVLLPEGDSPLGRQAAPGASIVLLVGPEGGFDEDETKMARLAGFTPIRMGNRVLRTETAAVAGLAALQALWGDFR